MIGVNNAVVVGVDQPLFRAALQGVVGAFRQKFLVCLWRALVIRRAVAAHLVHHHHHALGAALGGQGSNALLQALQHHFIKALTAIAQAGHFELAGFDRRNAVADAFAARLVVKPEYGQSGVLQDIQQALVIGRARVVSLTAKVGKHAGQ